MLGMKTLQPQIFFIIFSFSAPDGRWQRTRKESHYILERSIIHLKKHDFSQTRLKSVFLFWAIQNGLVLLETRYSESVNLRLRMLRFWNCGHLGYAALIMLPFLSDHQEDSVLSGSVGRWISQPYLALHHWQSRTQETLYYGVSRWPFHWYSLAVTSLRNAWNISSLFPWPSVLCFCYFHLLWYSYFSLRCTYQIMRISNVHCWLSLIGTYLIDEITGYSRIPLQRNILPVYAIGVLYMLIVWNSVRKLRKVSGEIEDLDPFGTVNRLIK